MRHKIVISSRAELQDYAGEAVRDTAILKNVNGLAYVDDTALAYLNLEMADAGELRGGHVRALYDAGKKQLRVVVEIDAPRKLGRAELNALRDEVRGQITDGIGEGAFRELSDATGLSIDTCPLGPPADVRCTQTTGTAWRPPSASAAKKTDRKRFADIRAALEKSETQPAAGQKKPSAKGKAAAASKPAAKPPAAKKGAKPNLKKLFRILDRYDRDSRLDEIEKELALAGGDLSSVVNGELPFFNLKVPKLLKMLLDANLDPNLIDCKGHTLLFLAAGSVPCLKALLARGVPVDVENTEVYRATALMRAAFWANLPCVKLLLEAGADAAKKDRFGETARDQVPESERNSKAVREALQAAGG